MTDESIKLVLSTAQDGRTQDLRYRQRQFRALHAWTVQHVSEIKSAMRTDDSFSEIEAHFLITLMSNKLTEFYDSLDLKAELASEYSVKDGRDNESHRVSEELVYVIPKKYSLISNVFSILCPCVAAGSCCILELSFDPNASTRLLESAFSEALDKTAFVTVRSRPPVDVLSRHVVVDQTGNVSIVGLRRLIRSEIDAVAVAVVDRTANLDQAAQEILNSIIAFSGRGPYVPTNILVNEFVEAKFLDLLRKYIPQQYSKSIKAAGSSNETQHVRTCNEPEVGAISGVTTIEHPCFRLVKVSTRTDLRKSLLALETRSAKLLATSSHDDAIDAINGISHKALLALYVFADPSAAKYLTQFIRTRVSFVNHIPTNMLVWPAAPVGYRVSPDTLYSRAMIEFASPQFIHPKQIELSLGDLTNECSQFWEQQCRSSLRPLKPTGQPMPRNMNFFTQGLVVGVVFYLLPIVAITVGGSAILLRKLWGWKISVLLLY